MKRTKDSHFHCMFTTNFGPNRSIKTAKAITVVQKEEIWDHSGFINSIHTE